MRKLFLLFFTLVGLQLAAVNWVAIQADAPSAARIELISSNIETSVVSFQLDGFELRQVQTDRGTAYIVKVPAATSLLAKGEPDLPKLTASLVIPDLAAMKATVISSQYTDYHNILIAPSKGNLSREVDPSGVPYTWGSVYERNDNYPGQLSELREPYIIRDVRGQTLIACPFQYNPATRTLRVYHNLVIRMETTQGTTVNPLAPSMKKQKLLKEFNEFYGGHFLNYKAPKYTPIEEEGCMLIISHGTFMAAMQPFVDWKISKGIPVEMVSVTSIGNSQAIRSYIQNYYLEHDLAYILLVGDHQQVPAFMASSGASDNSYGYLSGTDHYIDAFVGRFSAENEDQVATHVNKVLYYEINPITSTNWFESCIGIASSQGPGDDNEMDYEHIRNLQTQCNNYTYDTFYEFFDGSQGGLDAAGDPTPSMVATAVNTGASSILYCGHGSTTSWGSSGFNNSNVNSLTNYGKLPFIWAVACVNGDFTGTTCFAEAWLRAKQGSELTGAIATLMSTINQSWNPPMEGQDEMVSILVETYPGNIKRTFGGISLNGCAKMIDTYAGGGESMADTWNLFGDPSIQIRTAMPVNITASHDPTVFLGMSQFTVSCPFNGALACITLNGQILGTANISGGAATITFPGPLSVVDTLKLVISAYNHIPYIAYIPVITASGPYMAYQNFTIADPSGNNNGIPDFGENVNMNLTLKNLGVAIAAGVNATISTTDTYITITDNSQSFGDIQPNTSATQGNAFAFTIASDVPDQHAAQFNLSISDNNGGTWNSSFSVVLHAPVLQIGLLSIDDATGNSNGTLDPGETVTLLIQTSNIGSSDAPLTGGTLTSTSSMITITQGSYQFNTLSPGSPVNAQFTAVVSPTATIGMPVDLNYQVSSGAYGDQHTFYSTIGLISEDFESGDFSQFNWFFTGGAAPWTVTTENPYEGMYCSRSGVINNNQISIMQVTMNVIAEDSISFYRRVSSEETYDFLAFFIDNTKKEEWSGEQGWERAAYAVSPGTHTFKWRYRKDYYQTAGSDAAWVDFIKFPPVTITTGLPETYSETANGLDVYPNPASDIVYIDYSLEKSGPVSLDVYDIAGKLVKRIVQKTLTAAGIHSAVLPSENLENGIYFVRMQVGESVINQKLIKQR